MMPPGVGGHPAMFPFPSVASTITTAGGMTTTTSSGLPTPAMSVMTGVSSFMPSSVGGDLRSAGASMMGMATCQTIDFSELSLQRLIGSGAYGKVRAAAMARYRSRRHPVMIAGSLLLCAWAKENHSRRHVDVNRYVQASHFLHGRGQGLNVFLMFCPLLVAESLVTCCGEQARQAHEGDSPGLSLVYSKLQPDLSLLTLFLSRVACQVDWMYQADP